MPPSFQRSTPRDCTGPSRGAASRWLCGRYARRASCALANILDWTDGRRSWRSRRSPSSPCFGWSLPLRFGAGDGIRCWRSARVLGHGYGCPEHILEVAVHFPEDFFGSGDVAFIERLTCHRQALIEAAQLLYQFLTTVLRMRSPGSVDAAQTRAETEQQMKDLKTALLALLDHRRPYQAHRPSQPEVQYADDTDERKAGAEDGRTTSMREDIARLTHFVA